MFYLFIGSQSWEGEQMHIAPGRFGPRPARVIFNLGI